ncbi:response regulator transcription factor [Arthrobacter sp. UM1]|uniref:response regulator transcription factor n=1 Tax=Arthrobacter sp. UM1 TaxID=2766776 RepID=UPI00299D164C|nr:response regulator transcription factor [Arthrobacter sp. UM1]MCB4208802.1 response regulator transcription factor [Arthrobacter sp. UM1]
MPQLRTPTGELVRVALAEDLPLLREGISAVMARAGCEIALSVGNAEDLHSGLEQADVDLVVTDVRMPPDFSDEGLRAVRCLRREHPEMPVLILSQYASVAYLPEILDQDASGGLGYLLKERVGHVATFISAIEGVLAGATIIDPDIVHALMRRSRQYAGLSALSPRELEVLELMAQGQTNGAIAERLWVSEAAVRKHVGSIFAKLPMKEKVDRRVSAVLTYLRSRSDEEGGG